MSANLNIAALTHRTGVPPDTIRKWEQRYSVLQPARTAGGQRRYSELDVARIEWLKARLEEGYRIGEAAKLLGSGYPVVAGTQRELVSALVEATVRADVNGLARLVEQALSAPSLEDAFVRSLRPRSPRWERSGNRDRSGSRRSISRRGRFARRCSGCFPTREAGCAGRPSSPARRASTTRSGC